MERGDQRREVGAVDRDFGPGRPLARRGEDDAAAHLGAGFGHSGVEQDQRLVLAEQRRRALRARHLGQRHGFGAEGREDRGQSVLERGGFGGERLARGGALAEQPGPVGVARAAAQRGRVDGLVERDDAVAGRRPAPEQLALAGAFGERARGGFADRRARCRGMGELGDREAPGAAGGLAARAVRRACRPGEAEEVDRAAADEIRQIEPVGGVGGFGQRRQLGAIARQHILIIGARFGGTPHAPQRDPQIVGLAQRFAMAGAEARAGLGDAALAQRQRLVVAAEHP